MTHRDLSSDIAAALGRIPSGLFVVSARRDDVETAFLGSWIMQAGFEPPAISVAVGAERTALAFMQGRGRAFAVSVIGEGEREKLGPFYRGIAPAPHALAELDVERTPAGLAVVRGCLAWLECATRAVLAGATDHALIVGEVLHARLQGDRAPTIHVRTNGLRY